MTLSQILNCALTNESFSFFPYSQLTLTLLPLCCIDHMCLTNMNSNSLHEMMFTILSFATVTR